MDEESDSANSEFWGHLKKVGTPTHNATDDHVPLYMWGDDAEFTEHHQDKLVVISIGRVLEKRRHSLRYCWPLCVYIAVSWPTTQQDSFNILIIC